MRNDENHSETISSVGESQFYSNNVNFHEASALLTFILSRWQCRDQNPSLFSTPVTLFCGGVAQACP